MAKYLQENHNATGHELHILPILKPSKFKSECVILAESAHHYPLDAN